MSAPSSPLSTLRGPLGNRSRGTALLCYHSIHPDGPPYLSVSPEAFEQHLSVLRRLNYVSGTLADLDSLSAGRHDRRRRVYLTFDDGYVDNHTLALPLLRRYGFTALVFLVPPLVGTDRLRWPDIATHIERYPEVFRPVSWEMVEEMREYGIEFGSHTLHHPHLPTLGDEELRDELLDSRMALKRRLGECRTLCYPFGEWTPRVAQAAADAGYDYAFTLPPSGASSVTALSIPRMTIDHRDGRARFALKLLPVARRAAFAPMVDRVRLLREARRHRKAAA